MTHQLRTLALVALLGASLSAQNPRLIWSNAWTSGGPFQRGITMRDTNGALRPLAIQWGSQGGTAAAIDRPLVVDINGTDWLYWWDDVTEELYRGSDVNGNGVIDLSEMESVWDNTAWVQGVFTSMQSLTIRYRAGRFILSEKSGGGNPNTLGVVMLNDFNGDGDFRDHGETQEIVNGGTGVRGSGVNYGSLITVDGVSVSSDSVEAADFLPNGDVIFFDSRDDIWVRREAGTGAFSLYLNHGSIMGNASSQLPIAPLFDHPAAPALGMNQDLEKVCVQDDGSVFLGVGYEPTRPWIFRGRDLNGDGDINDGVEISQWWDGSNAPFPAGILSMDAFGNALYVAVRETHNLNGAVHILRLVDLNADGDANDGGELMVLESWPAGDAPRIEGLSAVADGTFGSTCVRCDINDTGITSIGGTLYFEFDDIPNDFQGNLAYGLVAISISGESLIPLAPGCGVAITLDPLSDLALGPLYWEFSTGIITGPTALTHGHPYAPGIPYALPPITYAGVILHPWASMLIATPTKLTNEGSLLP